MEWGRGQETFVRRFKVIHGDEKDYSERLFPFIFLIVSLSLQILFSHDAPVFTVFLIELPTLGELGEQFLSALVGKS